MLTRAVKVFEYSSLLLFSQIPFFLNFIFIGNKVISILYILITVSSALSLPPFPSNSVPLLLPLLHVPNIIFESF